MYDPKFIFAELTDALLSDDEGISGKAYDKLVEIYFGMYGDEGVNFLVASTSASDDRWFYDHDENDCAVEFYYEQTGEGS